MLGLTPLGIIHTAISLIALGSGMISLIRYQKITWSNLTGKTYIITTILTCVTGFGIFQHGGFGAPHALGIITLVVIGISYAASKKYKLFGKFSPFVETVSYSLTFFFHLIPGITETATRLPVGNPLATGPNDPNIQKAVGLCFLLFLIGATLQIIKLRKKLKNENVALG